MTRATWSEKYPETEHRVNVSTAILGVGIFIVGLILLAVGLIIGLKFPDFAQNRVIEEQCVTSKSHSLYKKWVSTLFIVPYCGALVMRVFEPRVGTLSVCRMSVV